ncbi:MAG: SDR family NAD(P)-dependent oxidoreductase [Bacillota bacterium]|nr:MAG: hypothetical protein DIU70_05580 [Bacillota bacterium]
MKGRVVVLTGASSGIGRAIAEEAAQAGARLVLVDVNGRELEGLAEAMARAGREVLAVPGDVTVGTDVERCMAQAVDRFGRLDALVCCAGVMYFGATETMAEADWDRVLSVNLKGTFLCNQAAIRHMLRQGGGVILNIASQFGLVGGPYLAAYCASKGGIVLLTRALALEYARRNIRINCLCPGPTSTPMLRDLVRSASGVLREAVVGLGTTPVGRVAMPTEVARAAVFLLSDAASYITGCALTVDGGWTAG